jgi:hypothetical protein
VPKDKHFDLLSQTREALLLLGTLPGPNCEHNFDWAAPCLHCLLLFSCCIKKGTEFGLSRQATLPRNSAMIISCLLALTQLAHLASLPSAVACLLPSRLESQTQFCGCRAGMHSMWQLTVTSR